MFKSKLFLSFTLLSILYSFCLTLSGNDIVEITTLFNQHKERFGLNKFDDNIIYHIVQTDIFTENLIEYKQMHEANNSSLTLKATYKIRDKSLLSDKKYPNVPVRVKIFFDLDINMLEYRYENAKIYSYFTSSQSNIELDGYFNYYYNRKLTNGVKNSTLNDIFSLQLNNQRNPHGVFFQQFYDDFLGVLGIYQ